MRLRAGISGFLLVSCAFFIVNSGCFAAATQSTTIASVSYVDGSIKKTNGAVEIRNDTNKTVTLQNNPTTTAIAASTNKEVATVGWADTNRTSKVRSGGANGTTLVDVWIE